MLRERDLERLAPRVLLSGGHWRISVHARHRISRASSSS
ncbi:hypothetical protein BSU04_16965 [Caballeronia sordidicola]|uniref:Uncharacterized protein n=1 Tax=Caballeronia sordidicola TaxID=196367 RepID=A0A226X0V9_CABSO|nr:hypothetical protein BSU04_21725 [Caballeronia sordidicola]OXC77223.1 hypothetical protein BSU04_16965 [Caballeronia sordidicola]